MTAPTDTAELRRLLMLASVMDPFWRSRIPSLLTEIEELLAARDGYDPGTRCAHGVASCDACTDAAGRGYEDMAAGKRRSAIAKAEARVLKAADACVSNASPEYLTHAIDTRLIPAVRALRKLKEGGK